jgi:hypothetical protein
VSPAGSDATGDGSAARPWRTLAFAASRAPAGSGATLVLAPGTYRETAPTRLPPGVSVRGAGAGRTVLTADGPLPGGDPAAPDAKEQPDGALIQLESPQFAGPDPRRGGLPEMLPPVAGSQSLSGFTIDGNGKRVKAGLWIVNRNDVTLRGVEFRNLAQRGAVITRGAVPWYVPLPEGRWVRGAKVYDCTFTDCGARFGDETTGNLCLGGLYGADVRRVTIRDRVGYGIKFIHVGHFRNLRIADCSIRVSESEPRWGECASVELWNLSRDNEIRNVTCNTWLSLVNHARIAAYAPTAAHPTNVRLLNVRVIDEDGRSDKEAVEAGLGGVEVVDCYFQDKGFGVAIWGGKAWGGADPIRGVRIHHNVFANVRREPSFGFGRSAAVFVPDPAEDIRIENNVFDNMGDALCLEGAAAGVRVANNLFLGTSGADVRSGGNGASFTHNLKDAGTWSLVGPTLGAGNLIGDPGLRKTGARWGDFYRPAAADSRTVDQGTDVGQPLVGRAPDIGRWEWGQRPETPERGTKKR